MSPNSTRSPSQPAAGLPSPQRARQILAVVCAAAFFGVLNASAVVVVLPAMGTSFGASAAGQGWVMGIFLLTYGVAIPVYGRLADRYGARTLYLFGLGLFGAGSLLCALAPGLSSMLTARVVQALGGAAFPGLGMTLASRAFAPQRRGVALGAIAATMGVGSAVGPLAGGLIADALHWRFLFGISGLAVFIIPVGRAIFPQEPRDDGAALDLVGGALLAAGVTGALLALSLGSQGSWSASVFAAVLAAGAFTAVAIHQGRVAAPFLPRALVHHAAFRRIVAMGFFTTGSNLAALVGFPMLLTRYHELSAFEIGLVLMPGAIMTAVVGVVAGKLVDRRGARLPTLVGSVLMVAVMLGLSMTAGASVAWVAVLAGVLGGAYSLINTPLAATIANLVPPKLLAAALSLNIMVFFVGGSFGTTCFVGVAEARVGAAGWNPLYGGPAGAFSDAFLVFAAPMMLTAALALVVPRVRAL